jgi:GTPase
MGEAIYEIGVEDDGVPTGLSENDLNQSIATLEKMAKTINADVSGTISIYMLCWRISIMC